MTSLVALFLAAQMAPKTIELSATGASASLQIHMLSGEDDPALPVLAKLISAQSGVRTVVLPGMLRMELETDRTKASDAVALLCNALSPVIDESAAETSLARAKSELGSYVVQARWGSNPIGDGDPDQLIANSWQHATANGAYFLVGQGDFGGEGLRGLASSLPWPGNRRPPTGDAHPLSRAVLPDGVEAVQWRGTALKPGSVEWTEALVAMCALGSGPGGTLQDVCRRQNGWSYDQDAVLWPTRSGSVPVATMFRKKGSDISPDAVQKSLLAAVDTLSETDRARAIHLAKLALSGDGRWSPLLIEPDRAYQATPSDKVAWRGFAEVWSSSTSFPSKFTQPCEQVSLARLKEACRNLLADSRQSVLD